jgi:hypothetical protein
MQVLRSPKEAKFILSLPICRKSTLMHFEEWIDERSARAWLAQCGLTVDREEVVFPVAKTDFFADKIEGNFRNYVSLCSKPR